MSDNMAMSSTVVDQNAYENSIGLATSAQNMFSDLTAKNVDKSDANTKISTAFTKLLQDLNGKANVNTIMTDVHVNLHPVLISAYNVQEAPETDTGYNTPAVPEFPLPALLIVISIAGVVAATRFRPRLGF